MSAAGASSSECFSRVAKSLAMSTHSLYSGGEAKYGSASEVGGKLGTNDSAAAFATKSRLD